MSSEILLAMTGTQAQDESINISGNMRWSYEKRMKSGRYICCRTSYGYDFADGTLSINEKEAKIVRDIFRMFLSGTGKQKIAAILNEQQVPRRYGKDKWYHFTIDYILRNERYMGNAMLQKSYTTDTFPYKKVKNHGERSMYYVENSHPPIISKEDFEAVREILEKRKHKSHREKTVIRSQNCSSAPNAATHTDAYPITDPFHTGYVPTVWEEKPNANPYGWMKKIFTPHCSAW